MTTTVRTFLISLGLGEYAAAFEANEIDQASLRLLTDTDLKELGMWAMGPRRKLLAALAALAAPAAPDVREPRWPADLPPDALPTFLAYPWRELNVETHPRVRLHWLVDLAELCVRWSVVVALSEVVHAESGRLPPQLRAQLREQIERPTLGRWLGMLRTLSATPPIAALAPAVFQLHDRVIDPLFRTEAEGGTVHESLLVLRNHLAHGGGVRSARAEVLLRQHLGPVERLLRASTATTAACEIVAADGGRFRRLHGCHPSETSTPRVLQGQQEGVWLVGPEAAVSLMPLARFGPVVVGEPDEVHEQEEPSAALLYLRRDRDRLFYTPVGRDEAHADVVDLDPFRQLFALHEPVAGAPPAVDGFAWNDQLREARVIAEGRVGRERELATVKAWLRSRQAHALDADRLGLISAGPGAGKSMLMAALATAYANTPASRRGLYYHRFRAGDSRNDRRSFLRLLRAALWSWPPLASCTQPPSPEVTDGRALEDDVAARLAAVATLAAPREDAPRPAFWVFVDGLDEAADGDLPYLFRRLAVPGTVWLVASRAEFGSVEALEGPGCTHLFDGDLPMMSIGDIRAMLMEGLGSARIALVRRDRDGEAGVVNPFVESVARRAGGLPLYVDLVLADLSAGRLTIHDDLRLPASLTDYYNGLLDRIGLSTVKRDLPLIVALLARAQEPLDEAGLTLLIAGNGADAGEYAERVAAALRAGEFLLRRASLQEGGQGLVLYHQSFRDYLTSANGGARASALAGVLREAERLLVRFTDDWRTLPVGALRNHLFRWGTRYAVAWGGEAAIERAATRLRDFGYLMDRASALMPMEVQDLPAEYACVGSSADASVRPALRVWEGFFRQGAHLMLRGDLRWPANRILLQLAVEHADDSPVTRAAEAWLESGACNWIWLRARYRPQKVEPPALRWTAHVHESRVLGAVGVGHEHFVTWDQDGTLVVWSKESPHPLARQPASASSKVVEVTACGAEHFVARGESGELTCRSVLSPMSALRIRTRHAQGALFALTDRRFVSLGSDGTVWLLEVDVEEPIASLQLAEGAESWSLTAAWRERFLAWSTDCRVVVIDARGGSLEVEMRWRFPEGELRVVRALQGGRVAMGNGTCTIVMDFVTGTEAFRASQGLLDAHPTGGLLLNHTNTKGWMPSVLLVDVIRFEKVRELRPFQQWHHSSNSLRRAAFGSHGAAVAMGVFDPFLERDGVVIKCPWQPGHFFDCGQFSIIDSFPRCGEAVVVPHGALEGQRLQQPAFAGACDLADAVLSFGAQGEIRLWDVAALLAERECERPRALRHVAPVMDEVMWGMSFDGDDLYGDNLCVARLSLRTGQMLTGGSRTKSLLPLSTTRCLQDNLWFRDGLEVCEAPPELRSFAKLIPRADRLIALVGTRLFTVSSRGLRSVELESGLDERHYHTEFAERQGEPESIRADVGEVTTIPSAHVVVSCDEVEPFVVLEDGRLVASIALEDGSLRALSDGRKWMIGVWSLRTGALLARLEGFDRGADRVTGILHVSGDHAIAWSSRGQLVLWSMTTGKPLRWLRSEGPSVQGAKLRVNGELLTWTAPLVFERWNLDTGRCTQRLSAEEAEQVAPGLFLEAGLRAGSGALVAHDERNCLTLRGLPDAGEQPLARWIGDGDVRTLLVTASQHIVANVGNDSSVVLTLYRGNVPLEVPRSS